MTSKRESKPELPDPNRIQIVQKPNEGEDEAMARGAIMPSVGAALTIRAFSQKLGDKLTIKGLIPAIREQAKHAQAGNLDRTEAMLIAQAHSLDSMFNELAQRAARNMGDYLNATDIYLRLALKAQSQCRATLETLAEIKYPKSATFVRQQNVGVNQQVNNGAAIPNIPRAGAREDSPIPTNKLLEHDGNGWQQNGMDTGTTSATSGANRELEAVGTLDRPSEQTR
jgi:cell division protein FtsB